MSLSIAVVRERLPGESRVALVPETAKKSGWSSLTTIERPVRRIPPRNVTLACRVRRPVSRRIGGRLASGWDGDVGGPLSGRGGHALHDVLLAVHLCVASAVAFGPFVALRRVPVDNQPSTTTARWRSSTAAEQRR